MSTDLMTEGFHPIPPLAAFRVVGYRRENEPIPRPFAAFRLLHPETGKPQTYATTDPVKVAGMIRGTAHEVAKNAGRDPAWIGQYVCGHHDGPESFPRFSYLPLPSLVGVGWESEKGSGTFCRNGPEGASHKRCLTQCLTPFRTTVGRISRVLIAEPIGSDGTEITWLKPRLAGFLAKNEQDRHALLVPLPREDKVLGNYVKTSPIWTTVTPVALPGSDDGQAGKTAKLLAKMLRHAGYSADAVLDIEYHRVPFLRGGEDATRYRPRGDHYLSHCTMYHMRIRWKQPVRGPLALGAGRHCGLGIFAAADWTEGKAAPTL